MNRLLSRIFPVGGANLSSIDDPSQRDLAKLYNRFSAILVTVELERSDSKAFASRVRQAQRVSRYESAGWKVRRTVTDGGGRRR